MQLRKPYPSQPCFTCSTVTPPPQRGTTAAVKVCCLHLTNRPGHPASGVQLELASRGRVQAQVPPGHSPAPACLLPA